MALYGKIWSNDVIIDAPANMAGKLNEQKCNLRKSINDKNTEGKLTKYPLLFWVLKLLGQ